MPHLILEHNIEDDELVGCLCSRLHDKLCEQETVKRPSVKTRSSKVNHLILGSEDKDFFTHLHLKLLPGRDDDLKLKMSQALLSELSDFLGEGFHSVEVSELQSYSKS